MVMFLSFHNICILVSAGMLCYLAYFNHSLTYLAAGIFVLSFLAVVIG
jgi:hypothetical protein